MAGNADCESEWKAILAGLAIDEAVLLPGIEETGGELRRFRPSSRSTIHVRHKAKYIDLQLVPHQGFVFTDNGKPTGTLARTLNEFVLSLKNSPLSVLDSHAQRGDFSQWIGAVFHDHALAADVRKIEQRCRLPHTRDLYTALSELIRDQYELSPTSEEPVEPAVAVTG
jgi:hypothetical protein